jgi:hypothetical protein
MATTMHFPTDAWLTFLTNESTNDRYLVDTSATLSIVPCKSSSRLSGPLLKGANGLLTPSWGFISKVIQFQGELFTSHFLQAKMAGPIMGIDFLRKFKITIAPETSQILFACMAAPPATAQSPLSSSLKHPAGPPSP